MLRAPADAVPKVRPASPATASPVRETRMQAWKRSRTSPVEKRAAMIRANRRRRLYPGVLMAGRDWGFGIGDSEKRRSEEHTSELQSLMRISYAVFCLKKEKQKERHENTR